MAETLMQVAFAIAYGFLVTMAFYKGGSLIPCILSHSLFDMFAPFASEDASPQLNWIGHGVILVLAVLYCLYLIKRVDTPPINRIDRGSGRPQTGEEA